MAYSTIADVRAILTADGDPADQESPNPTPDSDFTDAITQADGEINLYLGARYVVPIVASPAPEPVRTWSRVIAAWNLYSSWRKGQPIDVNDPVRLRYTRIGASWPLSPPARSTSSAWTRSAAPACRCTPRSISTTGSSGPTRSCAPPTRTRTAARTT